MIKDLGFLLRGGALKLGFFVPAAQQSGTLLACVAGVERGRGYGKREKGRGCFSSSLLTERLIGWRLTEIFSQ